MAVAAYKVLLIDNQAFTRIGIRTVLEPAGAEVAEAATAAEGFDLFRRFSPDVTVLALRMPDSCALDVLGDYFAERPKARIVILAERAGDAEISKALKKGAAGYICKDATPEELIDAVRTVAAGRKYIPKEVAAVLSEHLGSEELTRTETRVLQMIVGGMSNKEIGFALDVTENTVKSHIRRVFEKLGVSDRTSAATTAIRRGLVRIDV